MFVCVVTCKHAECWVSLSLALPALFTYNDYVYVLSGIVFHFFRILQFVILWNFP